MKDWCAGSNSTDFDERPYLSASRVKKLAKCHHCTRVFRPTVTGHLRLHQVRGPTTRSMDKTMDSLWGYADVDR